jgi:hypothetical protein
MIIALCQNPSRHCDDLASGERRSLSDDKAGNLKRSTIQERKKIARLNDIVGQASSPESFRDPRNDVRVSILIC